MLSLSTTQPHLVTVADIDITFSVQIVTTSLFVVSMGQTQKYAKDIRRILLEVSYPAFKEHFI
jgi:hypothetical protein